MDYVEAVDTGWHTAPDATEIKYFPHSTGANANTRFVGATTSGAPVAGTFQIGDFVVGRNGNIYICTVAGSPGTWVVAGSSGVGTGVVIEAPSASTDNVVQPTGAAVVPLTVKGFAGQSANLTEWQDSTGTLVARFTSDGSLQVLGLGGVGLAAGAAVQAQFVTALGGLAGAYLETNAAGGFTINNRTAVANIPLVVKGMAGQTGDLQQWQDSTGAVLIRIASNGSIRTTYVQDINAFGPYIVFSSTDITINSGDVSEIPLILKGMVGQTADLQEWQDSTAAIKARVTVAGQGRFQSLGIANSAAAAVGVGAIAKKMEVFDAAGASLGFVPIYASIT